MRSRPHSHLRFGDHEELGGFTVLQPFSIQFEDVGPCEVSEWWVTARDSDSLRKVTADDGQEKAGCPRATGQAPGRARSAGVGIRNTSLTRATTVGGNLVRIPSCLSTWVSQSTQPCCCTFCTVYSVSYFRRLRFPRRPRQSSSPRTHGCLRGTHLRYYTKRTLPKPLSHSTGRTDRGSYWLSKVLFTMLLREGTSTDLVSRRIRVLVIERLRDYVLCRWYVCKLRWARCV